MLDNLFGGVPGANQWGTGGQGYMDGMFGASSQAPFGSNAMMGMGPDMLSGPGAGAMGLGGMFSGGNTPQQRGFGIQATDSPFAAYTVPRAHSYGGGAGNSGLNMMQPGAMEQYGQDFRGAMNRQPMGSNRAEEWFQQFRGSSPPSLDPYYDHARERQGQDVDNALSARGMFGSSAGMQAYGDAMTGLNAEQANREGDYQLQRNQLGGNLASSADNSSRSRSQDTLGWLMGGANVANSAQNAQRMRGQDFMGNIMGGAQMTMPILQQGYGNMLAGDMGLMDQSMMASSGLAREALDQSYRNQDRQKADAEWGAGMMGSVMGGFM